MTTKLNVKKKRAGGSDFRLRFRAGCRCTHGMIGIFKEMFWVETVKAFFFRKQLCLVFLINTDECYALCERNSNSWSRVSSRFLSSRAPKSRGIGFCLSCVFAALLLSDAFISWYVADFWCFFLALLFAGCEIADLCNLWRSSEKCCWSVSFVLCFSSFFSSSHSFACLFGCWSSPLLILFHIGRCSFFLSVCLHRMQFRASRSCRWMWPPVVWGNVFFECSAFLWCAYCFWSNAIAGLFLRMVYWAWLL